jgi:EAL domain-containing protein (putative c-di-GMP-specific phosphodiesterase class I)
MSPDNNDIALCEAIIVMADKLNIEVIAEGIETAQQRQLLATAGCTFGQGYLLSKPLLKKDFEQFLINNNSKKSEF